VQDCFTTHHNDFDDGQIYSAVTQFSSFNQEGPHEFMFKRPSQDNLEGGDHVAVEAEELESRKVLPFPKTKSQHFEHNVLLLLTTMRPLLKPY
jgi:hypothetical protein